jgi:hypothetical protein
MSMVAHYTSDAFVGMSGILSGFAMVFQLGLPFSMPSQGLFLLCGLSSSVSEPLTWWLRDPKVQKQAWSGMGTVSLLPCSID